MLEYISTEAVWVRSYALHGLNLMVQCKEKASRDECELLFSSLPFEKSERLETDTHLTLAFTHSNQTAFLPPEGVDPYVINDAFIFDSGSSVIITDHFSTLCIEQGSGTGLFSIHPSFHTKTISSKYNFFMIGLIYLFSHQGLYDLHGAALSHHGTGYLFVGDSKSGKSSIAISLVRKGWNYASDDSLLLKATKNQVDVLSFRKRFYIDPSRVSKYPELDVLIAMENYTDETKCFLDLDEVYPDRFQPVISPVFLLFTKITTKQKSAIQPVSKGMAFANILKQSASIFFNRQATNVQADILKKLINQCRCYELHAGRDLYDNPCEILNILPDRRQLEKDKPVKTTKMD